MVAVLGLYKLQRYIIPFVRIIAYSESNQLNLATFIIVRIKANYILCTFPKLLIWDYLVIQVKFFG